MNFLKNLLSGKEDVNNEYAAFWGWFASNAKTFQEVVKNEGDIDGVFFDKLAPKLDELRDGYLYSTGMMDGQTAELILTADGAVKNIVFVEALVNAAPAIPGWKITALKQPRDMANVSVSLGGYEFSYDTLSFYPVNNAAYPDEIEIVVVHPDATEENKDEIRTGVEIFLDNYLGELNFATSIDYMDVANTSDASEDLVPMQKLRDYLIWREKEFIEKYEGIRHDTADDNYTTFEGELEEGEELLAVMNTDLLQWDSKASHPWIVKVEMHYETGDSGMPDENTYQLMDEIEGAINDELKDADGYLNVGRQTGDGSREVYYACREFRKSSEVISDVLEQYSGEIELTYELYKDKYWRTFGRFEESEQI